MQTFQTFPVSDPPLDRELAASRIVGQDELLDAVEHPLIETLIGRVDSQENALKSVYRPATLGAAEMVAATQSALDSVTDPIFTTLNTRLANQSGAIQSVMGVLPSETRDRIVPLLYDGTGSIPNTRGGMVDTAPAPQAISSGAAYAAAIGKFACEPGFDLVRNPAVPSQTMCIPAGEPHPWPRVPPGEIAPLPLPPITAPTPVSVAPPGEPAYLPTGTLVPAAPVAVAPPLPTAPVGSLTTCTTAPPTAHAVTVFPWEWIRHYWYAWECHPGCPVEVHSYVTSTRAAPVGVVGTLIGPFDTPLTDADIRGRIRDCSEAIATGATALPAPAPVEPPAPIAAPPAPAPAAPVAVVAPVTVRRPGGIEWVSTDPNLCDTVQSYVAGFARVGNEVMRLMLTGLDLVQDFGDVVAAIDQIPTIGKTLSVLTTSADVIARTAQNIKAMFGGYGKALGGPQADTLIGLWFTRGLVTSMENFHFGVNFVVTADIQISVVPKQIVQIIDYLIDYLHPVKLPDYPEVIDGYLKGEITRPAAECLAKLQGYQPEEMLRAARTRRDRLSPDEEIRHWQRWREPNDVIHFRLDSLGMLDRDERDRRLRNAIELPAPSDAIRFVKRDVFDPKKLGAAEMKEEFRQQVGMKELLASVGIEPTVIKSQDGTLLPLDIPLYHWMASYEECSPTQVYEQYHRLRPNRVNRFPLVNEDGSIVYPKPVGLQTVRSLLKEADYNPIWRDRLAAIAFRVPGRIDTRNMYRRGVFGAPKGKLGLGATAGTDKPPPGAAERELWERYLDMGYSPIDAGSLTSLDAAEFDRIGASPTATKAAAYVCRAYRLGIYDRTGAVQILTSELGSKDRAEQTVGQCDLDMRVADLQIAANGVKKQFIRGTINSSQAIKFLTEYGVNGTRAQSMLATWQLHRTSRTKEVAAAELLSWLRDGIISRGEVKSRLVNLGYSDTDANRVIRHAELGELAKTVKEKERVERAQRAEANRLARAAKTEAREQTAAQEKRLTRFLAGRSEKNLKEWWQADAITEQEIRDTFAARGWNPADIDKWVLVNRPKG